jgi:N-acetylglucosaminyldiphosphoundecaprenol N-acetyl-beta-D-mannosaminyltransferase
MRVDHVDASRAVDLICGWSADMDRSRVVCAANVHMTMEARDHPEYREMVNHADLVLPDGVPMVWALRALGLPQRRRVRVVPDLLIELFAQCEARGLEVGLYGGTPESLEAFVRLLGSALPGLRVAYAWPPPFRPLTATEDAEVVAQVRRAGVKLLLVGLGCPKQESWMADHASQLDCVMFGVGAAFDVFAGKTGNAPEWMRDVGLEWAYRLSQEPRRLWRRHLFNDPRFLALLTAQVARERRQRGRTHPSRSVRPT